MCAEIIVTPDPTIDIQPTNVTICEGGTIASPLTVSYTQGTGVGNVTYQWYDGVYPTGTIGTGTGQNTDSYTPITNNLPVGIYEYYAIISFDGNDCDDAVSNQVQIEILSDPVVDSITPTNQIICQNAPVDDICVFVSGGTGTYQYQWWEIVNGGTPTPATGTGANTDCYTPQNNTVNITEYYCVITQSGPGCEVTSSNVTVEIIPGPTFTTQPQDDNVCVDAAITINVAYTNGTGTPTYQWYENSICDPSTATPATGTGFNTDTYTPNTSIASTTYYFCVISFPANTGCNNITSLCAELSLIHI